MNFKQRKVKIALIAAVGLIILAIAWGAMSKNKDVSATQDEEVTPVKIVKAAKGELVSTLKISGKVAASKEVTIVPKVGGKVTDVKVKEGQKVKRGDLLIALDDADIRAQIRVTEASLEMSKAGQQTAVIAYQEAQANLERMKALFAEGAISKSQLETAENNFARAAASYTPDAGGTQTAAQIKQAQAQLEAARINLQNTRITAPIDGTVAAKNIEPGEMAGPGSPVLTIADMDQMVVEGNLAESEVNFAKVGDEVKVYVTAADEEPFQGYIESVSPIADPVTKAYSIKVWLENGSLLLKGGMAAEIYMTAEARDEVLVLPREALLDQGDRQVVYVVDGDKARERVVTLGLTTDEMAEIVSGLKAGEQVVISGQQFLIDGTKVTVASGGE
ncbi:efflux RND transporter periplasmic adaptor subunit [Phosphitispora fastidiosa]|uniref:efflux RND transporter periplasmic adaptor subunit n=1 Tax=Phosphitispora fastidiosa TaxID=2837202 RepID=UPI001E386A3E|nr:efflux RND transporter periplasmic adaptor subunit [Phosphitispora fastidiosa]MBU7006000.1 RND family efflux transporter MFP subunit [Phosphitispora fastidiosa]